MSASHAEVVGTFSWPALSAPNVWILAPNYDPHRVQVHSSFKGAQLLNLTETDDNIWQIDRDVASEIQG